MAELTDLFASRSLMKEFNLSKQQLNILSLVQILHLKGQRTTMRALIDNFNLAKENPTLGADLIKLRESGYLKYERNKRGQRVNMNFYSPGLKMVYLEERYKELCYEFSGSRF